jgi:uncharacterized protein (DUF302 family)
MYKHVFKITLLTFTFFVAQFNVVRAQHNNLTESSISFTKVVSLSFDEALAKVKTELKNAGFGILTEVDIKATMKKKLDTEYRPYHILGACNPKLADKALQAEPQIGLMLPCKWIVYVNDQDQTVVAAVDPVKMMDDIDNEELNKIALEVQLSFKNVLAKI